MRDHRQRKGDGPSLFPRSRRLWTAILVGLAMGLIVSLGTFSSREYRQIGLLERRSSNLATKFAEQVGPGWQNTCLASRVAHSSVLRGPASHRRSCLQRRRGGEAAGRLWQTSRG